MLHVYALVCVCVCLGGGEKGGGVSKCNTQALSSGADEAVNSQAVFFCWGERGGEV